MTTTKHEKYQRLTGACKAFPATLTFLAGADAAGIVLGARSRGDGGHGAGRVVEGRRVTP